MPSGKRTDSVPSRAATFDIARKGMARRTSPPRKCRTSVSSLALPLAVFPLNRAVTSASLPIARLLQQRRALGRRKPLDRVPQRRARNPGAVRAEVALEPTHVGFAGLA